MTIEINRPELEALIHKRMATGAFRDVEEVLMQALKSSPVPQSIRENSAARSQTTSPALIPENATGELLVTAMQASPAKDLDLDPGRVTLPTRDISF